MADDQQMTTLRALQGGPAVLRYKARLLREGAARLIEDAEAMEAQASAWEAEDGK